jgi:ADP-heptose:LPS heptosyltransferase
MLRWTCQPLHGHATIALIANDAIGNFVIATSLAGMVRRTYPGARISLWSGSRVRELAEGSELFDRFVDFLRRDEAEVALLAAEHGPADLVINIENGAEARRLPRLLSGPSTYVCGPAELEDGTAMPWPDDARGRLWADQCWTATDLPQRFPMLRSAYIGEIFCRLAGFDGPVPRARVRREPCARQVPDVLIAMSASLPDKLWTVDRWSAALGWLRERGLTVGLLGARPSAQSAFWLGSDAEAEVVHQGLVVDWRGSLTLPQVVDAMALSRCVLTLDNGIMHLAATTDVPVVALFRNGIDRLWAPPWGHVHRCVAEAGCAVATIPLRGVLDGLQRALDGPSAPSALGATAGPAAEQSA